MDKDSRGIIYVLLALAALCVVAITTLDILDRTNSEVLTIFGTTLATIVGAVAGVVVGQKQAYKVEAPKPVVETAKPEVEPVPNPAEVDHEVPAALKQGAKVYPDPVEAEAEGKAKAEVPNLGALFGEGAK